MSSFEESSLERDKISCLSEPVSSCHTPFSSDVSSPTFKSSREDPMTTGSTNKFGRKAHSYAYRIRDHVRMGPKISETVKGNQGEKLLKASQCYLSTTSGPIAGILFISTAKVAFCSERSITVPSSSGHLLRTPYKVSIPVNKIRSANESENVKKPEQKYIQIVTEDDFEFWFMGFVRYEKAFMNLHKAIQSSMPT
ncbi:hypothetical protein NMG60_11035221 [Bertholletia excelsa]